MMISTERHTKAGVFGLPFSRQAGQINHNGPEFRKCWIMFSTAKTTTISSSRDALSD